MSKPLVQWRRYPGLGSGVYSVAPPDARSSGILCEPPLTEEHERNLAQEFARQQEKEAGITPAFTNELIKRSDDADCLLIECGFRRLHRAVQAAIELYEEGKSAGRTKEGE